MTTTFSADSILCCKGGREHAAGSPRSGSPLLPEPSLGQERNNDKFGQSHLTTPDTLGGIEKFKELMLGICRWMKRPVLPEQIMQSLTNGKANHWVYLRLGKNIAKHTDRGNISLSQDEESVF